MKKKIIILVIIAFPVVLALLLKNSQFAYSDLPVFGSSPEDLPVYSTDEMGEMIPYTIEDFSLIDQNGQVFTRDSIGDRIVIANFFFASCPEICPTINGHLKIATEKLKNSDDIVFLSHTVDPYRDTVEVLHQYAADFEADYDQWKFLTGRKSTIYHLATRNYRTVLQEVPDTNDFIHSDKVMLVDKDFHVRGIYDGLDFQDINHMIEDARFLLKIYKDKEAEK